MRTLGLVVVVALAAGLLPVAPEPGLTGAVLMPDGGPALFGSVSLRSSRGYGGDAQIDAHGDFRYEPRAGGIYEVRAHVPGFIARPMQADFPRTGDVILPAIQLLRAPYARARILSPTGEPVWSPRIEAAPLGVDLMTDGRSNANAAIDADGRSTRIGPLPYGRMGLTIDQFPYARMRLSPLQVSGDRPLIDIGTVTLEPGATIDIALVDESQSPVAGQDVSLTQMTPPLPSISMRARTDSEGHATFERLASGAYLVRTPGLRPCGVGLRPVLERTITTVGRGTVPLTINVGGFRTRVSVMWGGIPLGFTRVAVIPQLTDMTPSDVLGGRWGAFPIRVPAPAVESGCHDVSDAEGALTIASVPAGRARLSIAVLDSVWTRRVAMPPRDSKLSVDIPPGVGMVRVANASNGAPIAGAMVTATSGGARIETRTTSNGGAIVQGIADGPLGITVTAPRFRDTQLSVDGPPATLQEIGLEPLPDMSLACLVIARFDGPLKGAVVAVVPQDPLEEVRVAVTNDAGIVLMADLPAGRVQVTASRDGYVAAARAATIPLASAAPVILTLEPRPRVP